MVSHAPGVPQRHLPSILRRASVPVDTRRGQGLLLGSQQGALLLDRRRLRDGHPAAGARGGLRVADLAQPPLHDGQAAAGPLAQEGPAGSAAALLRDSPRLCQRRGLG